MVIITIILLVIDILSKLIVSNLLEEQVSIEIIHNFLNITYVKNTGAAFSIMDNNFYIVLIISSLIGAISATKVLYLSSLLSIKLEDM